MFLTVFQNKNKYQFQNWDNMSRFGFSYLCNYDPLLWHGTLKDSKIWEPSFGSTTPNENLGFSWTECIVMNE